MPTTASRDSWRRTKISTSCTSRWSSMPLILASSSRRLLAISSFSNSSKTFYRAECQSRLSLLRSWALMLCNVNNPINYSWDFWYDRTFSHSWDRRLRFWQAHIRICFRIPLRSQSDKGFGVSHCRHSQAAERRRAGTSGIQLFG